MRNLFRLKTWAGPLTIGSFVVMAVTGVMLFFHRGVGMTKLAHEWIGWLLVVGGLAHLLVNWRAFFGYFRTATGVAIIAVVCLAGAVAMLLSSGRPSGHGAAFAPVLAALDDSTLSVAAQVAKCGPESAIEKLQAQGIKVQDADQTIGRIAKDNKKQGIEILAFLLDKPAQPAKNDDSTTPQQP